MNAFFYMGVTIYKMRSLFSLRYRLNKPLLTGISNSESRQPGKAPSFSVNWTLGDAGLEVINAMTGIYDLYASFCVVCGLARDRGTEDL